VSAKRADARRKRITGSVEEALGKLTGIDLLEASGAKRRLDGKVEEAAARTRPPAAVRRGGRK
jgi:uncharacterized protein YjbJ (UPF0337 family)